MPWVPISSSGIDFTFSVTGSPGPSFANSTVTAVSLPGANESGFEIQINGTEAVQLRVTVQSYSGMPVSGPDQTNVAYFDWDGTGGPVLNSAPDPTSAFEPAQVEATVTAGPGTALWYYGAQGSEWVVNETYSMLIEAWSDQEEVSYNCECDDDYPSKTLAQMREYLMIRLGWGAMKDTPLPGVVDTLNSFIVDAQEQIYRQYKVFRMERYFTWDMEPGVRFYDLLANRDECTKKLDPRMITWVGVSQEQNTWRPLVCGIRPTMYWGEIESIPTHYEIRQCIEVWPAPQDDSWQLRIKGYFGLLPLAQDTDINTVDYEAIQLYALANAKAHYGQPDAANYMAQYREYIGNVTAGTHMTRRYVPGAVEGVTPPLPVLTGYPGDP